MYVTFYMDKNNKYVYFRGVKMFVFAIEKQRVLYWHKTDTVMLKENTE